MLNITILAVGKLKESYWREASAEYIKRLSAFCKMEVVELPEYRLSDNPSPAEIARCIQKEGEEILSKVPRDGYFIPLCVEGKEISSEALAEKLRQLPVEGVSRLVFAIGGSYGLSDAVKARGQLRLSVSKMTFPHQLFRVMLLEQIYRGFMIGAGNTYHK